jgi:hypothetical protein
MFLVTHRIDHGEDACLTEARRPRPTVRPTRVRHSACLQPGLQSCCSGLQQFTFADSQQDDLARKLCVFVGRRHAGDWSTGDWPARKR